VILDFTEARDDGWQWYHLDHIQIICTSPQAGVKEGPVDCIRIDEVATALKKMKRHKAQAC